MGILLAFWPLYLVGWAVCGIKIGPKLSSLTFDNRANVNKSIGAILLVLLILAPLWPLTALGYGAYKYFKLSSGKRVENNDEYGLEGEKEVERFLQAGK